MTGRNRNAVIIGVGFFLAIVGLVVYSSFGLRRYRVEVCMEFNGRTECRNASGTNRPEAIRTATDNACTLISSGMTEFMNCERSQPASVRDLR